MGNVKGLLTQRPHDFWAKTRDEDGCKVWTGARYRDGYGQVHLQSKPHKCAKAHRVAWQLANGPIPDGLHVLHRCDNPPCINPEHLFLGTQQDNNRDRDAKGRVASGSRSGARRHPAAFRRPRKLTDGDVVAMRQRYAEGERLADLSRAYGVAISHVFNVVNRKVWRHVA